MNIYMLILIISVTVASFAQILLKIGADKEHAAKTFNIAGKSIVISGKLREYLNVYVIFGYGLMFLSLLMTMISYRGFENFANVPLLESLGYIVVMFLSRIFFKEHITIRKIVGMAFIMGGIFVYYMVN